MEGGKGEKEEEGRRKCRRKIGGGRERRRERWREGQKKGEEEGRGLKAGGWQEHPYKGTPQSQI